MELGLNPNPLLFQKQTTGICDFATATEIKPLELHELGYSLKPGICDVVTPAEIKALEPRELRDLLKIFIL